MRDVYLEETKKCLTQKYDALFWRNFIITQAEISPLSIFGCKLYESNRA